MSRELVVVDETILDLRTGRALGDVPRTPLAITSTGLALVPAGGRSRGREPPRGPLRWVVPRPMPELPAQIPATAGERPVMIEGVVIDDRGKAVFGATARSSCKPPRARSRCRAAERTARSPTESCS